MQNKKSIKIFILDCKEYENFFVVVSLSFEFKKHQFLIKKSALEFEKEIIVGLIYVINFTELDGKVTIYQINLHDGIDIYKIDAKRLFAVQSLCNRINKIIYNIDDMDKAINLIPKIYLIFSAEKWFDIYLYLEFKLLLIYDYHNMIKLCNRDLKINYNSENELLDFKNLFYGIKKDKLEFLNEIWSSLDENFSSNKERIVFNKLLDDEM